MEKKYATDENNYEISYEGAALAKRAQFMAEQVKKQAAVSQDGIPSILDLGCGLGHIPYMLGTLGYKVQGVDLDSESIAACQENNNLPNVSFTVGDAEKLELPDMFDVVIASEVIEHVTHPDMVINTMHHHLKESAVGIISIPNGYCLWEIVVSRFIQKSSLINWFYRSPLLYKLITGSDTPFYSKNTFCFHSHFFSYRRLMKLIGDNGFQLIVARNSDLGILPEWSWLRPLKQIECKLADYVPKCLAGGWLLVIKGTPGVKTRN